MSQRKENRDHLDVLANKCIRFSTRYGEVKGVHKEKWLHSSIKMTYADRHFSIEINVNMPKRDKHGACIIVVKIANDIVFEAKGDFATKASNVTCTTYTKGEWERYISDPPR